MNHVSDDVLESYHLGTVIGEAELAPIEEHLLICPQCVRRAEEWGEYIDSMRAAMMAGDFDLEPQ
jgi:hypothetical protein